MKKSKKNKQLKKRKQKVRVKSSKNKNQVKSEYVTKKEWTVPNKVWLVFLILCLVFLYFMPNQIVYGEYQSDLLLLLLMVVALPFLVFKTVKSFYGEDIIALLSCIFLPLFFGFTSVLLKDYQKEKELLENGKITQCFVINRETEVKNKGAWLIKCKYSVDGVEFTTYAHNEKDKQYQIGDTLEITYNKEFPRMYRINIE